MKRLEEWQKAKLEEVIEASPLTFYEIISAITAMENKKAAERAEHEKTEEIIV